MTKGTTVMGGGEEVIKTQVHVGLETATKKMSD